MGLDRVTERGSKTVERTKGRNLKELDEFSDNIERLVDLSPGISGQIRAHEELLGLASSNMLAYTLVLKLLKDLAKSFENATHSMSPTLSDSEIARTLMYNTGAWQALVQAIHMLQPPTLEKNLDVLRKHPHSI